MSSDERAAPSRNRTGAGVAFFGSATLLGLILALPSPAAKAQDYPAPWQYPYYDGYPPPLPPRGIAPDENGPSGPPPRDAAREENFFEHGQRDKFHGDLVPLAEIRRRVALLGFHLIATPRHKDRIYLAEAEDAHGLRHRIVFDAYEGNIIENTKLATRR